VSPVSRDSDRLARASGVAAAVWGAALLAVGGRVWTVVAGRPPAEVDKRALRVLGARHLVQGVAQASAPALGQRFFAGVDAAHAASMVWLAVVDDRRRRPAVVSGVAALVAASLTLSARLARVSATAGGGHRPVDGGSQRPRHVRGF
jgi:hypothetical protein